MMWIQKIWKYKKSHIKIILIYYIGYETLDFVKAFYVNVNKIKEYTEDNTGSKYLTLIPDDENKGEFEKYKGTWNKIKMSVKLENNEPCKYDVKYITIIFNSDYNWLLKQPLVVIIM